MDNRQQAYGRYNNNRRSRQQCPRDNRPASNVDTSRDCPKDPCDKDVNKAMDKCVDNLPLAMAYVPMQKWENVCDGASGLAQGTIFKDLVKPYCPVLQKRGDR